MIVPIVLLVLIIIAALIPNQANAQSQPLPEFRQDSIIQKTGSTVLRFTQLNWFAPNNDGDSIITRNYTSGKRGLVSPLSLPVSNPTKDSLNTRLRTAALTAGLIASTLGYTPANAADTVPSGNLMTVTTANNSIGALNASINGKVPNSRTLTINGVAQDLSADRTWTVPTISIAAPSAGNSFTSGTAFQPRSGGQCMISVQSTLSGIVGVTGTVTISMSATSGGTYTTVSTTRLLISVLAVTADMDSGSVAVPSGWWVKVTNTGGITGTYTRWNL